MRLLTVITVVLMTACATTRTADTDNGFVAGNEYLTTTTLFAVNWGERTELVNSYQTTAAKNRPTLVKALPAGTRITVVNIQQDNTLTRGIDAWPQGKILNGEMAGSLVSLDASGLGAYVTKMKTRSKR